MSSSGGFDLKIQTKNQPEFVFESIKKEAQLTISD